MLTTIRDKTQGIIATIILGLLIIPFALWGINSYFEGGLGNVVAEVNGTEISKRNFDAEITRYRQRAPRLLESKAGRRQILDGIIEEQLQIDSAQDMGFVLSDEQIRNMIFGYFRSQGSFDPASYQYFLSNVGQSAYGYETALRRRGAVEQLRSGVTRSAIVTDTEVNDIIKLLGQQRTFDYVAISLNPYLGKKKISDADIKKYYEDNQKQFMNPEKVKIEYVVLSIADLAKQSQPTAKEVRDYYLANKSGYFTPEKRRVSHILVSLPAGANDQQDKAAQAKAASILKKARAGANFAALARKHSDDTGSKARGGDVGVIQRGRMVKEFEAAAYQLKPGRVSGLVKTQFGYHILKLTKLTPSRAQSFNEVKDRIRKTIALERADARFAKLYSDFNNYVYEQSDSLKPVATALGLKIHKSDWITKRGGPGLLANRDVIDAAFNKEVIAEKRNSDTLELGSDKLVALRIVDHRPEKPRPLTEVKTLIQSILKRQHAQSLAVAAGEKILKAARSGKDLSALSLTVPSKYKANNRLVRRGLVKLPVQLRGMGQAVFRAGRPKDGKPVIGGVEIKNVGYIVFSLSKVVDGTVPKDKKDRGRAIVQTILQQRRGAGYYQDYTQGLKDEADIKVFEKLL